MTIDELTDRQLDALIAERLFGFETQQRANIRTGEKDLLCRRAPGGEWMRTPFYAVSVASRIDVELALRDRGWTRNDQHGSATGEVRVILQHADGRVVEASGPPKEALCRAALKVCGLPTTHSPP